MENGEKNVLEEFSAFSIKLCCGNRKSFAQGNYVGWESKMKSGFHGLLLLLLLFFLFFLHFLLIFLISFKKNEKQLIEKAVLFRDF